MKPTLLLAIPLAVAASLGLPPHPATDPLSFTVHSGTQLSRTFESRQEISLDDSEILLNNQPFPSGDKGAMTAVQGKVLQVVDELAQVESGAPRLLRRTFEKIESSGEQTTANPMGAGEQSDARKAKSELTGKTVVFEWDAAKSRFAKRFDPEGPDEALLGGLVEDLDFRELLPPQGKASDGDAWPLDLAVIKTLFLPGGELALKPVEGPEEEGDDDDQGMSMLSENGSEAFSGLTGDVKATYKGAREVDGAACGVIAIEFKVSAKRDLSDKLPKSATADPEISIQHLEVFLSLEGEGELVWDLSAGHARSFHMSAKIKNQAQCAMKVPQGDKFLDITNKKQMSGSYDLEVSISRR